MKTGGPKNTPEALRRLAAAADLQGNADGVATPAEIEAVAKSSVKRPTLGKDVLRPPAEQAELLAAYRAAPHDVQTLAPELQALPKALRRLAIEIDGLWGNADGVVSVDELDRLAQVYLSALPFFVGEAKAIVALADHLGFLADDASVSVVNLRAALDKLSPQAAADGADFRALFDEAIAQGDVPGVPELLRTAALHTPRWHSLSVLEHTALAVTAVEQLATAVGKAWKDAGAVMLLHDIGKLIARDISSDGGQALHYSFRGHETLGANWLATRGVDPSVTFHVRHHADIRYATTDEVIELAADPDRLAQMVIVYVADQVAKGNRPAQLESFEEVKPKLTVLADAAGIDSDALFAGREKLLTTHFGAVPAVPDPAPARLR